MADARVIFDGRWFGDHGIGRFAWEVSARLPWDLEVLEGAHPVSGRGLMELDVKARRARRRSRSNHFLSPGFCPPLRFPGTFAFTIHDLIHVDLPAEQSLGKRLYYDHVVRPAARRAEVVYTVSEFSRQRILEWARLPDGKVVVAGNGVDDRFFAGGRVAPMRAPYILHVGNHKPHKNLERLVAAFALMNLSTELDLVLTGDPEASLIREARRLGVSDRLVFAGRIPDGELPGYYQGAVAVAIPSLYEGFGLPALEGMAAGVPVVASCTPALVEVVGDAAVLVDPMDVASIAHGLDVAASSTAAQARAADRGPARAGNFSWQSVADRIAETFPAV